MLGGAYRLEIINKPLLGSHWLAKLLCVVNNRQPTTGIEMRYIIR